MKIPHLFKVFFEAFSSAQNLSCIFFSSRENPLALKADMPYTKNAERLARPI